MKKFLLAVFAVLIVCNGIVFASPASKWKCSLCGQVKRQAITAQPGDYGCKSDVNNHKHIWFQIE